MFLLIVHLILFPNLTFAKAPEMNGYTLGQFGEFYKKWNLVTVRFRQDTKELRFTYANDVAFTALKSGAKYPDGAMFAKIGMKAEEDAAFPNSIVPSNTKRYQFMVRDEKKFAETGGWGYALFNAEGGVFPEDQHKQSLACAACHAIVPNRQFVFSQLAPFDPKATAKGASGEGPKYKFNTVAVSTLSKENQEKVPKQFKSVRMLAGDIADEPFIGTINEIQPTLIKESFQNRMPAVMLSKRENIFEMAAPSPSGTKKCPGSNDDRSGFTVLTTVEVGLCFDKATGKPKLTD